MDEFEEWLIMDHELNWNGRLERLKWLRYEVPEFEHGFFYSGGPVALHHWQEAQYCFIQGQFVAVTMLCLAFIERTLTGRMYGMGFDEARKYSAYKTIEKAADIGMIDAGKKELFHSLRKLRNPIAHFREPNHDESVTMRAIDMGKHYDQVFEQDAKKAMKAMFELGKNWGIGARIEKKLPPGEHPDQTELIQFSK